ncbi:DegT/DnrJ/EryC1/StrS family aminotransferase [Tropicibacter oceani]|uniref:DegT/DnrJ/EryC1/StrS family aminotransferase n=1 Tax=Tropicibacter oceani TaxID=3058420 RepID=A0ABY8QNM2_9RHOB|nr:DegT/DnrJ/EryC1/StrS family aminotransferase [Tropicibacter oceani]WGW06058.1 DegT/DnrJ/EryC1/StrS family aminotransferase [Tropicibacter oceani]
MPDDSPSAPPPRDKPLCDLSDLALFGARPLFDAPRHVNRPQAPDRAVFDALLDQVWDRRWFTNDGPLVQELERRLCDYLDVPHCVLTSNATAALDLVIHALGLEGEVLLPSFTFISTAHLLHLRKLTPVFCEVGADMMLDPADCAARMTTRTAAIIATHVWGSPCDIDALQALCDDRGIALLLDAAHAFGGRYKGRRLGGFGRAEVFSLHATKAFHACEGGLVTTSDADLAARLRLTRNFGFSGPDRVECAGVNAKMSELHAAMGLANLAGFEDSRAAAMRIHGAYARGLEGLPGLRLKSPPPEEENNHHYLVTEIDAAGFGMDRDALLALLTAENVWARRYFHPGGHRSPPHLGHSPALPRTEALCARVLLLPAGAAATSEEVAQICRLIRFAAARAPEIRAAAGA